MAKRDDCQELADRWDELNWQDYKMDFFETECCSALGERKTPTYRLRECGPWSNSNQWGRRWCNKKRPDKQFIRDCLHEDDKEERRRKEEEEDEEKRETVSKEFENESSSEDSEATWEDLDVNDEEDETSFQWRVDMQCVTDRNARRERHAARARKEHEEREHKERREREEHEREEERKEREERKREVKRKVYTNASVPPSKRLNPGLLGLEQTPAPTPGPAPAPAPAPAQAPCVIT